MKQFPCWAIQISTQSRINPIPKRDAILCRTNARAMELLLAGLVHGDKVSLQADHNKLNRFVDAASLLKQGKRVTDVPELLGLIHGMMCMNIVKPMMVVILNHW
jgi:hypothetical protein